VDVLESAGGELRVSKFGIMLQSINTTKRSAHYHYIESLTLRNIPRIIKRIPKRQNSVPCSASDSGNGKVRKPARPIAQLRRIATDSHPLADAGRPKRIQDKQLEPSRRTDMRIRRRCDSAGASGARHRREDRPLTHTISMCT
jgi:hypothetical protein